MACSHWLKAKPGEMLHHEDIRSFHLNLLPKQFTRQSIRHPFFFLIKTPTKYSTDHSTAFTNIGGQLDDKNRACYILVHYFRLIFNDGPTILIAQHCWPTISTDTNRSCIIGLSSSYNMQLSILLKARTDC